MVYCLTWMKFFLKQLVCKYLHGESNGTSILNLPDDVVINILSRLPTQTVLACVLLLPQWNRLSSTPYFAEIHVSNVAPVILVEDRYFSAFNGGKPIFLLLNGCGKNARFKKVCLKSVDVLCQQFLTPLLCSCDGILIFKFMGDCVYVIYNPITRDNFVYCDKKHRIFGFFFHELDRDYKLLLYERNDRLELCDYYLYGLRNKDKRLLGTSHCRPLPYEGCRYDDELAIVVSGAVFWMAKCSFKPDFSKECSQSIMMFDLMTEKFNIMPHPGSACTTCSFILDYRLHEQMRLLELDGMLSLCNVCERTIEVWILEDVKTWMWVKKYVVKLDHPYDHENWYWAHPVVAINNGNLLLNWPLRGIFWCNLASSYMWKVKAPYGFNLDKGAFYAIRYTSSFVSFESGKMTTV